MREVRAARIEVHGEHLVFLTAEGKLTALFLMDLVESWNEIAADVSLNPGHFRD